MEMFFVSHGDLLFTRLKGPVKPQFIGHVGYAHDLKWSQARGVLRFAVDDRKAENTALWQFARPPVRLRELERDQRNLCAVV